MLHNQINEYRPGVRAMRKWCGSDLRAFWLLHRRHQHDAPMEVLVKLFGEKL